MKQPVLTVSQKIYMAFSILAVEPYSGWDERKEGERYVTDMPATADIPDTMCGVQLWDRRQFGTAETRQ